MTNISIQGILFDEKSSYQRGPAQAPPFIREALRSGSMNLFSENGLDVDTDGVVDKGDFEIQDYFEIESITSSNQEGSSKILTLGGDHSITFPVVKSFASKHPKFDILHIDAHSDLYENYEGDRYSHACPFARIMEEGLTNRLVQVGIRTNSNHLWAQTERFGVEVHEMKNLSGLSELKFENPVYLSLDLDGLDPAYAPGVSHHEPGGLSTRQVIDIIHNINTELIGADIVEYNPTRDFQQMTAFLAAKLMKEILGKMLVR